MKIRKRIILPTILLTGALAVGSLGVVRVYAQDNTFAPIVQKLAQRFGLKEAEVQDVFEELRDERMANMHAEFEERLNDAIEEGKITEEQKQKILDKHEEIQSQMDKWRDLSPEERKEKMKAFHTELKKWAEENNIDTPFFVFKTGFKGGPKHQFGSKFIFNEKLN